MAFRNPIVAATRIIREAFQSGNYVEAVSGWRIDKNAKAQFENVNVTGALGATSISADTIQAATERGLLFADGTPVRNYVDRKPNSLIGMFEYNAGVNIENITSEIMILETSAYIAAGTQFEISAITQILGSIAGDNGVLLVRFTTDGSRPTTLSPAITFWPFPIAVASRFDTVIGSRNFYITSTNTTADRVWRFGLFVRRQGGTGTLTVLGTDAIRRPQLTIFETSPFRRVQGANGTDPDTKTTTSQTLTYPATWSQSYAGNGSKRDDTDGNTYAYQGYFSSTWNDQRSLVGFDYTKIQADLTGATNITCSVKIKCAHAGESNGLDVRLGTHSYTAEPATWDTVNVVERRLNSDNLGEGSSRTIDLGATIAGEFQTGASKGIAFGPTGDNAQALARYGYLFGAPSTSRPELVFTFDK